MMMKTLLEEGRYNHVISQEYRSYHNSLSFFSWIITIVSRPPDLAREVIDDWVAELKKFKFQEPSRDNPHFMCISVW